MATNAQRAKSVVTAFKESARRVVSSMQTKIRGTLIGDVRTKQIPEAPDQTADPKDTVIIHVADVRLIDEPDQPVARDVVVVTQARQLISSGTLPIANADDLTEGAPVELQYDSYGSLQVVGRLAWASSAMTVDTYELGELGVAYTWGLDQVRFSELDPAVQAAINADRATEGLVPLDPNKEFQSMTDAEILDIFGIDITEYNADRAAEDPPLPPVTAQEAVNIERQKKGLAPLPDSYKAMDLWVYLDYFDAIAVGAGTYSVPGVGRFSTPAVQNRIRAQDRSLLLYGSSEFTYGQTNYGAYRVTYK